MDKEDVGLGFSMLSLSYEAEAIYWAVPELTTLALLLAILSLATFAASLLR